MFKIEMERNLRLKEWLNDFNGLTFQSPARRSIFVCISIK
jgi:hypothetical protein